MTDIDLDAIKARAEAATPGPWVREWAFSTHFVVPEAAERVADGNVARLKAHQRADAEFIAHAREDVPALLAEVERLRRELAAEQTRRGRARAAFDEFARTSAEELRQALAEVERLRHNAAALVEAKGASWADGYETGCSMSHSLGCDAVAAERDQLREEVERLRDAQAPEGPVLPLPDACREMASSTTPGDCPAHGVHPHNGMTCLDCPVCWGMPAEEVTSGG